MNNFHLFFISLCFAFTLLAQANSFPICRNLIENRFLGECAIKLPSFFYFFFHLLSFIFGDCWSPLHKVNTIFARNGSTFRINCKRNIYHSGSKSWFFIFSISIAFYALAYAHIQAHRINKRTVYLINDIKIDIEITVHTVSAVKFLVLPFAWVCDYFFFFSPLLASLTIMFRTKAPANTHTHNFGLC